MKQTIEKLKFKAVKFVAPLTTALVLPFASKADWDSGYTVAENSALPSGTITDIIITLMWWLLVLLGAIAIIGFVIAGILYLTSAGDEERMEKAKRAMIYSIIGVIVAVGGFVVVQAVNTWLGGNSSDF